MATYKEVVLCFKNLSKLSFQVILDKLGAEITRGFF